MKENMFMINKEIGNLNRKRRIIKGNQIEILEVKNTLYEI